MNNAKDGCVYYTYHRCNTNMHNKSIDNLLLQYQNDRNTIVYLVDSNVNLLIEKVWNGIFPIDNECKCRMGAGDIRSDFSCVQCSHLRRIFDFRYKILDTPIPIQCGSHIGKQLILKEEHIDSIYLKRDMETFCAAQLYIKRYPDITFCGKTHLEVLEYIKGDSFTISSIINCILESIFKSKGLHHIPLMYTTFICSNVGYKLYENLQCTEIPINCTIIKNIWLQLLVIYKELSKLNFYHGNPSIDNLCVVNKAVSYRYENVNIISPVMVEIRDFTKSSFTFNGVHYFSSDHDYKLYIPEISTKEVTIRLCTNKDSDVILNSVKMYKLGNSNKFLYSQLRGMGIPLYVGSYDIYQYIMILMMNENFYTSVMNDDMMSSVWKSLWSEDDLTAIDQSLKDKIKPADALTGKWLRCDVIDHLWSQLSNSSE